MRLNMLTYFSLFVLIVYSVSTSILAAPVATTVSVSSPNYAALNSTRIKRNFKKHQKLRLSDIPDVPPVFNAPAKIKIDPSIDGLGKLLDDSCKKRKNTKDSRGLIDTVKEDCIFQLPDDGLLVLQQETGGRIATGKLGKKLGSGSYGIVYDVDGGWAGQAGQFVAKWFKKKDKGIIEIKNLYGVREIVYWGVDLHLKSPGMWAILHWKRGRPLEDITRYINAVNGNDKKKCETYMAMVRDVVAEANRPYLKLPGAPMHDDLHQGNVLFWETGINGVIQLHASIIDWGLIDWKIGEDDADEADDDLIDFFIKELKEKLAEGYKLKTGHGWANGKTEKSDWFDFSDENNCFQSAPKVN